MNMRTHAAFPERVVLPARRVPTSRPSSCRSLKSGSSKNADDSETPVITKESANGRAPAIVSPFVKVNKAKQAAAPTQAAGAVDSIHESDLNWNDIDSTKKTSFLKQAFGTDFLRKSSVYRDPAQENASENLSDFWEEPDTRRRFVKRCLIPTAVAFALGCLAYVLQVHPSTHWLSGCLVHVSLYIAVCDVCEAPGSCGTARCMTPARALSAPHPRAAVEPSVTAPVVLSALQTLHSPRVVCCNVDNSAHAAVHRLPQNLQLCLPRTYTQRTRYQAKRPCKFNPPHPFHHLHSRGPFPACARRHITWWRQCHARSAVDMQHQVLWSDIPASNIADVSCNIPATIHLSS